MRLRSIKVFFFIIVYYLLFFSFNTSSAKETINIPFISAIIVNSKTNETIYSYNADTIIYPASLTKIMTAYIVFDAINEGIIGLYDRIDKTKYYNYSIMNSAFYDTNNITIYDLLIQTIVKSSNESALILANEIANEEKYFVEMMNKKAKEIGMYHTLFVNSHGLYNQNHISTARDLSKLTISLVKKHPELSKIFDITDYIHHDNFIEKTTTIQRNNNIIGSKTGYISKIGYNIAIWSDNDKEQLHAIIIGANSKPDRDAIALHLINSFSNNMLTNNKDKREDVFNINTHLASIIKLTGLNDLYKSNNIKQNISTNKKKNSINRFYMAK